MRQPSGVVVALCAVACSGAVASAPLEGTRWALIEIHAQPADTAHPAFIQLRHDGSAVSGSTGCNRLIGRYALELLAGAEPAARLVARADSVAH